MFSRLLCAMECASLTLTGPGGMRQDALALQVARRAGRRISRTASGSSPWRRSTDPALVPPDDRDRRSAPKDDSPTTSRDRAAPAARQLRARARRGRRAVASCSSRARRSTVLATSREPLRVAAVSASTPSSAPEGDAVELFVDARRGRATRLRAGRTQSPRSAAASTGCRSRSSWPPRASGAHGRPSCSQRLDQRLPLLTGSARDTPERHRTLRATIEWSYDLLAADEQLLFARLAIFAGGFDVDCGRGCL